MNVPVFVPVLVLNTRPYIVTFYCLLRLQKRSPRTITTAAASSAHRQGQ